MAKPTSYLFRLIKSLTKNEKGYIKKMASRKGEKTPHFILLLDAIDGQEAYNEDAILRKEPFHKNLPRLKNYLHERILDALEQYHAARNMDMQLRNMLNQITVLFSKGFYDRCRAELAKAKELCRQYEKFLILLEVLEWERVLVIEKLLVNDLEKIKQEEKEILRIIGDLHFYRDAYDRISSLYSHTFVVRTAAEHEQYISIVSVPEFSAGGFSFQAQLLRCKTFAKYYAATDDRGNYLEISQEAVDLFEQHESMIVQDIYGYIRALNNLLATLGEHKEFAAFDRTLHKLQTLPDQYPAADTGNLKDIIGNRVTMRKFYRHFGYAEFDRAIRLIPEIEQWLALQGEEVSETHRYIFCYSIAYLFFIEGKYEKALERINILLNSEVNNETVTYICYVKMLSLIIHFEMEHYDLLEYRIAPVRKFLEKHNKLYAPEKITIDLLRRKLIHSLTPAEKREVFTEMKKTLEKTNDPVLYRNYEYFDLVGWAQSKAENRPFREMLVKRIRRE